VRKILPAIVIGVGAFLLTLALLMRFYAVPKLAVVPYDQNSTSVVLGPDSTYLNPSVLKVEKGTLTSTVRVIGDEAEAKKQSDATGRDLAIWDKGQVTQFTDPATGGLFSPPLTGGTDRIVFDRYTGEAVNCCGETTDGEAAEHKGQLVKFPFFTEKKSYDYWDGTTKKAYAADFKGIEDIQGLTVYRFEQAVPRQQYTTIEVPASLFGLPDAPVTANRFYENNRILWVEPTTGVVIKQTENQKQQLEAPGASSPLTILETTSTFDDATVNKNVEDYKTKSSQLALIKTTGPVSAGILGVLLLLGGILWSFVASRGRDDAAGPTRRDPAPATA
jgi:hypothetical protein